MMSLIRDWLGALFYCKMLDFEQGVLKAVASQMTGEDKVRFEKQLELIEKVDVDPFKTCFRLIMGKESARCERIDVKDGLILSRVHGVLDERPLTAEVGLCDGLCERSMLSELNALYDENKYNNLALILNGTEISKSGFYGNRYGYHYGHYGQYGYSSYANEDKQNS